MRVDALCKRKRPVCKVATFQAALITGPKIKCVISTGEKINGHFVDLPAPAAGLGLRPTFQFHV